MGYRTMTREDVAMIQERRISSTLMSPQPTSPMTPQNNVPAAPMLPPSSTCAPSPVSPPSGNEVLFDFDCKCCIARSNTLHALSLELSF